MMDHLPQSIDQVLTELDKIIETSIDQGDYLAIFGYVYRRTTAQIKAEILAQSFEDNERMEHLDVVFANRYLLAYRQFANKNKPTYSWEISFNARFKRLTIMQHLLLGMSTHINFDLGIAAAEIAKGEEINSLKNDFMKVNDILAELINEMQDRIGRVSRLMVLLDWIGGNSDEKFANYNITKSRQFAWTVAKTLSILEEEDRQKIIKKFDYKVAKFNQGIINPPGKILKATLKVIGFFEEKNIEKIVKKLKEN